MNLKRFTALIPSRDEAVDALAALTLTSLALFAFRSSYGGVQFLIVGIIAAVVGLVVAQVGQARRWPLVVTLVIALAVYAILASLLALRHYGFGGMLPSPRSIAESYTSAINGWKELVTTATPVGSTGDLMIIPVVSGFVTALTSYTAAQRLRLPVFSVLPALVLLGLSIAVGTESPVSVVAHGAVFVALVLAWLSWREQRRRPLLQGIGINRRQLGSAVAVLSIAGVAGFIIAPRMPGAEGGRREIWRQTVTPPFDPRQYPSPLSGYRSYVKLGFDESGQRLEPEVMFTVEGLPEGVPIRLATMDTYDGLVWQVSAGDADDPSLDDSGSFERVGASLTPEFDGELAEVAITIGKYADVWVPDVGEVVSMRFSGSAGGADRDRALASSFRYNRATDTGATVLRLAEGDRYEMTVRLPAVLDSLAGLQVDPDVARIGLADAPDEIVAPFSTPDFLVISDTAERLERIKALMVGTGAYSDGDVEAGQIRAKAGHSAFRLTEFVQDYPRRPFVGNAEQYSSTFALLFRDLDHLATRVVMGFLPSGASTETPVEVLANEAEAWVEVPIEGLGWVGVFPTPPRDQLSSSSTSPQQPEPDYRTQNPPPPVLDPEFDQPAKASGEAQSTADDEAQGDDGSDTADDDGPSIAGFFSSRTGVITSIVLAPILLALALSGLVVALKSRRRRRRRSLGAPHQRIANGWREVTDFAIDTGRPVPPTTTRREAATFVGESTVALATRTDAAVWGGADLSDQEVDLYWTDLEATLGSMKQELPLLDRVKATISTQSLKRRDRQGRSD